MHIERCTIWCGFWTGGIIGTYCFKNDENCNDTVDGARLRAMIINLFLKQWKKCTWLTWTKCHMAHDERRNWWIINLTFWSQNQAIWLPLAYFLLRYGKFLVYRDKSTKIPALRDNITVAIGELTVEILEKVCQNWSLGYLRYGCNQHLHEISFNK